MIVFYCNGKFLDEKGSILKYKNCLKCYIFFIIFLNLFTKNGPTVGADETIPQGRRFHTVSCQNKVQTYKFDENYSN